MDVLEEKNGADTELLIFAMTLINKVSNQAETLARTEPLNRTGVWFLIQVLLLRFDNCCF